MPCLHPPHALHGHQRGWLAAGNTLTWQDTTSPQHQRQPVARRYKPQHTEPAKQHVNAPQALLHATSIPNTLNPRNHWQSQPAKNAWPGVACHSFQGHGRDPRRGWSRLLQGRDRALRPAGSAHGEPAPPRPPPWSLRPLRLARALPAGRPLHWQMAARREPRLPSAAAAPATVRKMSAGKDRDANQHHGVVIHSLFLTKFKVDLDSRPRV